MNFKYRLMQFMYGRNGSDETSFVLLILSVALSFINIFLNSLVLQIFVYLLLGLALFRMLSRNTVQRRKENAWVKDKLHFIKNKKELCERRKNDKCHVYKKCPSCRAILRLPRRVGHHTTVCPKCGREFKVKVKK